MKQSLIIEFSDCELRVPEQGERVQVVGQKGEYMVLSVDHCRHTADLMLMTGNRRLEEGVLLRALRRVDDYRGNSQQSAALEAEED